MQVLEATILSSDVKENAINQEQALQLEDCVLSSEVKDVNTEEVKEGELPHAAHLELLPVEWDWQRFQRLAVLQQAARNEGTVELALDTHTGRHVAVKAMPLSWTFENHAQFIAARPEETERPWQDIAATHYLSKVAHLNCVCQFIGLFRRGNELCLVLSYCTGGDLFSWLERSLQMAELNREAAARQLLTHVLHAVKRVHAEGIAHGDLSLENVLITDPEEGQPQGSPLRLIDFGASTLGRLARGARGKPSYQAPEMHLAEEYDAIVADAFAVGVMAFTLIVGNYPWRSTRPHLCPRFRFMAQKGFLAYLTRQKIKRDDGLVESLSETISPSGVSFLSQMLDVEPTSRLTVSDALNHPWLTGA